MMHPLPTASHVLTRGICDHGSALTTSPIDLGYRGFVCGDERDGSPSGRRSPTACDWNLDPQRCRTTASRRSGDGQRFTNRQSDSSEDSSLSSISGGGVGTSPVMHRKRRSSSQPLSQNGQAKKPSVNDDTEIFSVVTTTCGGVHKNTDNRSLDEWQTESLVGGRSDNISPSISSRIEMTTRHAVPDLVVPLASDFIAQRRGACPSAGRGSPDRWSTEAIFSGPSAAASPSAAEFDVCFGFSDWERQQPKPVVIRPPSPPRSNSMIDMEAFWSNNDRAVGGADMDATHRGFRQKRNSRSVFRPLMPVGMSAQFERSHRYGVGVSGVYDSRVIDDYLIQTASPPQLPCSASAGAHLHRADFRRRGAMPESTAAAAAPSTSSDAVALHDDVATSSGPFGFDQDLGGAPTASASFDAASLVVEPNREPFRFMPEMNANDSDDSDSDIELVQYIPSNRSRPFNCGVNIS